MTYFNYNLKPNKNSISKRKLVHGIGVNDAEYMVCQTINGKSVIDKYYKRWIGMLERCYCGKFQKKRPTYIGCTVCDDWVNFSNFKKWMEKQNWKDKQLDKDLLIPGNKVYSPRACCFVNHELNVLLTDHAAARGRYPQGVSWHKRIKKYYSNISKSGKRCHIGYYDTIKSAESAYKKEKADYLKEVAMKQTDVRLKNALLTRSAKLLEAN